MNNTKSKRLLSLDVLRGLTVAGMILVNNGYGESFEMLRHSRWNGMTPCDLVFPFFLFIMGVSCYISLSKSGFTPTRPVLLKVVKRTMLLFAIGLFINWFDHAIEGDLLCFGPDRKYADGADAVTPENSFNTLGIQNLLLRSPRSDENIASHEKLRDAYEQTDTVAAPAELDLSSVERQISATNMTVINIPVFFPEDNYKTGSEYLEELNRQLYSQGLQDIIDEINLQLEAKQ